MTAKLVYKQIIDPGAWAILKTASIRDWKRLVDTGVETVKKQYPDAILRIGCECCYPKGPDIITEWPVETKNGGAELCVYIDFDFGVSEDEE